ncbi:hypothetical protein GQ55_7G270600 [Panicum hallii var. hallii]|uniref:Knottins-like domain-containing protein n=2 Tax=Panicum hallii TaxID=206008 RepID=A0A2T7CZG5_9POAL|nr:hypothetical protein PAHAL_7G278300 [Panicum hallii]PUZ48735.1 hypothetical protein GQ55_7G270600 [Panicum hallii var. hallii]
MDPSRKRLPAAIFLLLLLVVATATCKHQDSAETGAPVQAGDCLVFNEKWCGPCLKWRECADACLRRNEGFTGGRCRGFLPPYCFCVKPC